MRLYSSGKLDELMLTVIVCEMFKWTYQEYQDQPIHFLEIIREKLGIDEKAQRLAERQTKHGN